MRATWERIDARSILQRLDIVRGFYEEIAKRYGRDHPADPQALTAMEVWRSGEQHHGAYLLWIGSEPHGFVSGDINLDPSGRRIYKVNWIFMHGQGNQALLDAFLRSELAVDAVVVESPRDRAVFERMGFTWVSALYRKELTGGTAEPTAG